MKNFNENLFKSCIKGKVKFSTSTFVKFLITGTIALSLTACGGGGGGGGSSSVVPPIIEKPDVKPDPEEKPDVKPDPEEKPEVNQNENSNGNLITVNQKFNNKGDITLTNNSIGIIGSNSDITNDGDISISNLNTLSNNNYPEIEFETSLAKDCYDELQKEGAKVGIISEKGNVINNGDIKLNGTKNYGIVGVYSNIINNGDIISNNSKDSIGIVNLNGKAENYGTISMTGKVHVDKNSIKSDEVIGMYGYGKDAKIINEGIIELKHEIDLINPYDNIKVEPEYDFDAIGMQVTNGAVAINNKDIIGQGAITGMYANNGSIIKNTGNVKLTSVHYNAKYEIDDNVFTEKFPTYIYGMNGKGEGTKVENTGTIDMIGDGTGIKVADGAEGTNDGTVNLTSQPIKIEGNNAIKYTYLKGMDSRRGSTVTNLKDGIINLNGHGVGIRVRQDSKGYNYGNININSDFFAIGMEASNNGYAENRGNINLKVKNGVGISVTDSGTGTNHKDINILSNYYAFGMEAQDKGNVKNYGNITLKGKNGVGIKINDSGKGYNYGDITLSSNDYTIGIEVQDEGYALNASNIILKNGTGVGIKVSDTGKVENKGNIILESSDSNGIKITDNGEVENKGNIILNKNGSCGIEMFGNSFFKNTGNIISKDNNSTAILVSQNGTAENYGDISMSGKLNIDKDSVTPDNFIGMAANGFSGEKANVINNGTIKLEHTINLINPYDNIEEPEYDFDAVGMEVSNSALAINNKDIIGQGAITGMNAYNGANITNSGTIKLTSLIFNGKYTDGDITRKEIPSWIGGMNGRDKGTKVINEVLGVIDLTGEGTAIRVTDGAEGINIGTINLTSQTVKLEGEQEIEHTYLKGMDARRGATVTNLKNGVINLDGNGVGMRIRIDSKGYNYGTINISSKEYARGIEVQNNGYAENHGDIISKTENVDGIRTRNDGHATNYGNIYVKDHGTGMLAFDSSSVNNYGTITAIGKGSVGMEAFNNATAVNEKTGTINAGTGALGMYATDNGVIINKGTINVTEDARGGMLALNGGKIENYGKVIVDKDASDNVYSIFADNDANIKNEGEIITNGDVKIEVGGTYTIGTTTDKTFGKLTGNNISLNGNLVVTTDIAKGSYENSYKLDNMIEGENIILGDNYKNFSDSLLYDLEVSKDKDGNLDGELTRNENNIADFTSNNFSQVGKIFDKYLIKENYDKLSKEDKELVDKIFANTNSNDKVEEAIEKVAGREYLNISRQFFDIKDSFRKYDSSVIATLDKYDCNFNLIGEYGDIQSKDRIVGYDSKMTGFNGAFKLSDSLFGTIGYGYSDIDYDKGAEGKIQTIHGGIYKDYAYNNSNIRFGIFGEYNFHETDRENLFGNANADFNSYLVGVTGEISKKYGDSLYIQPKLSLDVAYGSVEKFDENNSLEIKEQDYTSVLPKVEVTIGKDLNNVKLFAKSSYSYELGNLDKDMEITLLNENIKVKNDTMDKGNLNLSVGAEANFESFSLNAELGREFGKRDREYVKAGFSYRF